MKLISANTIEMTELDACNVEEIKEKPNGKASL